MIWWLDMWAWDLKVAGENPSPGRPGLGARARARDITSRCIALCSCARCLFTSLWWWVIMQRINFMAAVCSACDKQSLLLLFHFFFYFSLLISIFSSSLVWAICSCKQFPEECTEHTKWNSTWGYCAMYFSELMWTSKRVALSSFRSFIMPQRHIGA